MKQLPIDVEAAWCRLASAETALAWWSESRPGPRRISKILKGGLPYLLYQASKWRRVPVRAYTFWGRRFNAYLPDYLFLVLYGVLGDLAELPLTRLLLRALRSDDVFFDIGANCGFYTALAADLVATGAVHAFEPTPEIFALLSTNVRNMPHVVPLQAAVCDVTGTAQLFTSRTQTVGNTLVRGSSGPSVLVNTVSLDEYCAERRIWPSYLKIDVEGAENLVIRGATTLLRTRSPVVILEVRYGVDETPYAEAWSLLRDLGYQPQAILPEGVLEPCSDFGRLQGSHAGFVNIAFIKS